MWKGTEEVFERVLQRTCLVYFGIDVVKRLVKKYRTCKITLDSCRQNSGLHEIRLVILVWRSKYINLIQFQTVLWRR